MYSRCNSYQFHLFSLAVDQTSYRNHEQKKSPTQRTLFDEADTGKTPTLFPVELLNFVQVVRVQFLDRSLEMSFDIAKHIHRMGTVDQINGQS